MDDLVGALGVDAGISQSEVSRICSTLDVEMTEFLQSLRDRGLGRVQLVISDSHLGLKVAISQVFPGAGWQQCRVHFMRNVLVKVPRHQQMVAATVRTIFCARRGPRRAPTEGSRRHDETPV